MRCTIPYTIAIAEIKNPKWSHNYHFIFSIERLARFKKVCNKRIDKILIIDSANLAFNTVALMCFSH